MAGVLVEAQLPALLYGHHMHHGVYGGLLPNLALHPLTGAGHGGTGGRDRGDQEKEEDTSSEASHAEEKLCWLQLLSWGLITKHHQA